MQSPEVSRLVPCAIIAQYFLHVKGSDIAKYLWDGSKLSESKSTLSLQHFDNIQLLSAAPLPVDDLQMRSPYFAASHDASGRTITWNIETGSAVELPGFNTEVTALTWLGNTLVFGITEQGDRKGSIVTYEPRQYDQERDEWPSNAILPNIAITAISPSPDNLTIAIGFHNGSILITTAGDFKILQVLEKPITPSIVTLDWGVPSMDLDASSMKLDALPMKLAVQAYDGYFGVFQLHQPCTVDSEAVGLHLRDGESDHDGDHDGHDDHDDHGNKSGHGRHWARWLKNEIVVNKIVVENKIAVNTTVESKIVVFSAGMISVWSVQEDPSRRLVIARSEAKGLGLDSSSATLFMVGPENEVVVKQL